MYKAIVFDLGKVLVQFDFKRGYRALEQVCPCTAAEMPRRLSGTSLVQDFETGLIEPHDFVARFGEAVGAALEYEQFCGIWSSIFTEPLVPEAMVEALAARYRVLLLSNTNAIHFEMIQRTYPMLRHFHDFVLSYQVKAMKPQRAIYEALLRSAGCRPEECFYTDDIPEYVQAARQLGIDAVAFESVEQLEREMRGRGIEW